MAGPREKSSSVGPKAEQVGNNPPLLSDALLCRKNDLEAQWFIAPMGDEPLLICA